MTPPPDVAALARQVARLRWMVAAALALAGVTLVVAATPVVRDGIRDRLEAREVAIRDDAGKVRARLDATGLSLYDDAGRTRVQALVTDDSANLTLYGLDQRRITFAAAEDGHLGLWFFDNVVRDRVRLGLTADGTVGFTLFDDHYVWRAMMAVTTDGETSMTIFDKRGHVLSRMPPPVEADAAPPPAGPVGPPATPHPGPS